MTYEDALPIRGWECRMLSDMGSKGPQTLCFPGFLGAVCERLVNQGLASKVEVEPLPKPPWWPKRGRKFESLPQFRYSITEAGRVRLAELERDAHDGESDRASA